MLASNYNETPAGADRLGLHAYCIYATTVTYNIQAQELLHVHMRGLYVVWRSLSHVIMHKTHAAFGAYELT